MEEKGRPIYASLMTVQSEIVAPKDKDGHKNQYKYRTLEGIYTAAKPILRANSLILYFKQDKIEQIGDRYYLNATAVLKDIVTGESIEAVGSAREPDSLAMMAAPQITGTASTYARKRALEGLFLLDSEKDIDSKEVQEAIEKAQTSQNAPQMGQPSNKGKYMASEEKTLYDANDAVRKASIAKLNAEINRIGLKPAEVLKIAKTKFGVNKRDDMSDTQLCILAENLEKWSKGE